MQTLAPVSLSAWWCHSALISNSRLPWTCMLHQYKLLYIPFIIWYSLSFDRSKRTFLRELFFSLLELYTSSIVSSALVPHQIVTSNFSTPHFIRSRSFFVSWCLSHDITVSIAPSRIFPLAALPYSFFRSGKVSPQLYLGS